MTYRLLLSGGRVYTEGIIDMEVWVNSDGMGKVWDQVHSISVPSPDNKSVISIRQFAPDYGSFS